MNNTITITPRRLLVIGLFGLLAVLSYGFAAANTFPSGAGAAGDGQASISGYAVTNVHYTLSSTNPTMVDSISFTLTPALPAPWEGDVAAEGPPGTDPDAGAERLS